MSSAADIVSEKVCLAAVTAALNSGVESQDARGYTLGDLKLATLPSAYTEIHLSRKAGDTPRRMGSASEITQWRLLTRAVARRYGDAQEMRRRAAVALEERTLTIAGQTVFIDRAESDDPIGEDDGWWSGLSEWSFAV